jgi:hypothetical protein
MSSPSTQDDLPLRKAAAQIGRDPGALERAIARGRLTPSSHRRWGSTLGQPRLKPSDLANIKDIYEQNLGEGHFRTPEGEASTVKRGAKQFGLPEGFIRDCISGSSESAWILPEGKLPSFKWPPGAERFGKLLGRSSRERGPEENGLTLILDGNLFRLKQAVRTELKRTAALLQKGLVPLETLYELAGITSVAERIELCKYLECWRENDLLPYERVLMEFPHRCVARFDCSGKKRRPVRHKDTTQLRTVCLYDPTRFQELWQQDYLADDSKAMTTYRKLIRNGPVNADRVKKEMGAIGICLGRLTKVVEATGARVRLSGPPGSPWVHERKPKGKPRPDCKATIESMIASGPLKAGETFAALRARGFHDREIYRAKRDLKLEDRRPGGIRGPFYWCKPGQHPTTTNSHTEIPATEVNGKPVAPRVSRRGRRARPETLQRYEICYCLYRRVVSGEIKMVTAMREASRQLGPHAPKEDSHLRRNAQRYAEKAKIAWPPPGQERQKTA